MEEVKKKYPELRVVLTLGKDGSVYSYKDEYIRQQIHKVKAVDTTAAGDTFTGYFISTALKLTVKEAMQYASIAAGIAASRNGAAPSIPEYAEVDEVIKKTSA